MVLGIRGGDEGGRRVTTTEIDENNELGWFIERDEKKWKYRLYKETGDESGEEGGGGEREGGKVQERKQLKKG